MQFETQHSTLGANNQHVASLMRQVLLALLPGIALMLWYFGWGALFNLVLASVFALGFEAISLRLRKRPVKLYLGDYSAIVTAWLLALSLPAFAPWWLILVATFFAIIVAKHLYGGLGYNPFNPAMIGYAVVLISFPIEMVNWFSPQSFHMGVIGFSDAISIVFTGVGTQPQWDAMTSATLLDTLKTGLRADEFTIHTLTESASFGFIAQSGWEMIALAYFAGGLWLIYKNIITWHIPVSMLLSIAGIAAVFWLLDADHHASPFFQLLVGGTMLGAFFIATDPISASTTPLGKLIYGATIGFIIYVIRTWGSGYPDGVAFAVIIMNMAVPMIDYYTRPKVFGQSNGHSHG